MSLIRQLAVGTTLLGLTAAGVAPAAAAARPAAVPYPVCYGSEAYVTNQNGQRGAFAKTSWCLRDDGYFETTTGTSTVKDLVAGDGVAARIWLWGVPQRGAAFKFERKKDTTATPGATGWGYDIYLKSMSIWLCLGKKEPGATNANCEELSPSIRYPW
ncbi:hypothetical protein [Streptomyces sp. 4F14]|uniref:hypothetical protein n=1 Tax=Streptomyces sp. 4F14 TaxID=3394380 RepID=UPI003A86070F